MKTPQRFPLQEKTSRSFRLFPFFPKKFTPMLGLPHFSTFTKAMRSLFSLFLWLFGVLTWPAAAINYGAADDLTISLRDELHEGQTWQIDNLLSLDAYGIGDKIDFHSQFLVTNDFSLTDSQEAQLTLAYLTATGLRDHWDIAIGRQFFSHGFDAYLGDGLLVQYHYRNRLACLVHLEAPFDGEKEMFSSEPLLVYGANIALSLFGPL